MTSLSFDGLVDLYDETRTFDADCFNSALDCLAERYPPSDYPHVFEPGVGTGRIAIPLAERGYRVTGADISEEMLVVLEDRLSSYDPRPNIVYSVADTTDLPFPDLAFDLSVVVHHFYFIPEWKKAAAEVLRVTDGLVVLMHTGTGEEIPVLNERYKELCVELGYNISSIGAAATSEVVDYLVSLGCRAERIEGRWMWINKIDTQTALGHIRDRAYSFTARTPEDVHSAAVQKLSKETERSIVEVPSQIYFVMIEREQR